MRSTPTARNPVTRGLAPVRARVNLVLITAVVEQDFSHEFSIKVNDYFSAESI